MENEEDEYLEEWLNSDPGAAPPNSDALERLVLRAHEEPAALIGRLNSGERGILAQIEDNPSNLSYEPFTIRALEAAITVLDIENHPPAPSHYEVIEWYRRTGMMMLGANEQPQPMRQLPVREIPESSIEEHIQNEVASQATRDIRYLQMGGIDPGEVGSLPLGYSWVVMDPPGFMQYGTGVVAAGTATTRTILNTEELRRAALTAIAAQEFDDYMQRNAQLQRDRDAAERHAFEAARLVQNQPALTQQEIDAINSFPTAPEHPRMEPITERLYDCAWISNSAATTGFASTARQWKKWHDAIAPLLDALFPETWDLSFESSGVKGIIATLTLLFPELDVSDTVRTQKIYDLYVRVRFNNSSAITGVVSGTRGVLSDREWFGNYAHSHLRSEGCNGFTSFCQGSTTLVDISTRLGLQGFFKEGGDGEIDPESVEMFEAYLHQLYAFMSHEATEGRPYRHIKSIGRGSSSDVGGEELQESLNRFLTLVQDKELPFVFEDNTPKVVYNTQLEEFLLASATRTQYMDQDGNFYDSEEIPEGYRTSNINANFQRFMFRGRRIDQVITHPPVVEPDVTTKKKYCHAQIRNFIIKAINDRIRGRIVSWYIEERTGNLTFPGVGQLREVDSKTKRLIKALVPVVQGSPHRMDGGNVLPHAKRKPRKTLRHRH